MAMWRCLPTGFASRVPDHPPSWDPHPIHREPTGSLSIHDLGCLGQDVGVSVAVGDRHCDSCRRRYDRGRDSAAGDGLPHRVQRVAAQTRPVACAVPFPPTGCKVPEALHDIRNKHSIVLRAAESRHGRRSVDDTLALAARAVALWLVSAFLSTSFRNVIFGNVFNVKTRGKTPEKTVGGVRGREPRTGGVHQKVHLA